ncbi:hypothetical protein PAAL109150_21190 [Paenibacillus alkaliterrae]
MFRVSFITSDFHSSPSDYILLIVSEERISSKEGVEAFADKQIYSYSYRTGMLTALPSSISAKQLEANELNTAVLGSDRVYLLLDRKTAAMAAVLDLGDGMPLYTGRATFEGPEEQLEEEMKVLRLMNITITQKVEN